MPVKLDSLVYGLRTPRGIGTVYRPGPGLSDKTYGHGAASGAILAIDPVNELIIVSCRNRTGKMHAEYVMRLTEACTAPLAILSEVEAPGAAEPRPATSQPTPSQSAATQPAATQPTATQPTTSQATENPDGTR